METAAPPTPNAPAPSGGRDALAEVFNLARKATTAYGRPDLHRRVDEIATRLDGREITVTVAGDYKQGKSSMVNALLRMSVCPTDDDLATAVPTAVSYGESTLVTVVRMAPDAEVNFEAEPSRTPIPFADLRAVVAPGGERAEPGLLGVEVEVPAPILAGGLVLVDCPGDGGLGSMGRMNSLAQVASAAALVFVSDATSELTATELSFLGVAAKVCPLITLVLSKTDLVPAWRDIYERNRARLDEAGLAGVEQFAVSANLRSFALAYQDDSLEAGSGFAGLERWLAERVVAQADRLVTRSALVELLLVVDQLDQQFEAERRTLADPTMAAQVSAELEDTAANLRNLRDAASRWQHVLGDGIADVSADIEHDLRDRLRRVGREADDTIDAEDPLEIWDTFEPWLYSRVADEVSENFALLRRRSADLAAAVGRLFQEDVEVILAGVLVPADPTVPMSAIEIDASVRLKKMGAGQRAFTALRGSYGGVIMASFVVAKAHIAFGPAAALMGVLMGNKAVKDEAERQLSMRRNSAKMAQRRYTDEVAFVVAKYSRDHLRHTQRNLRDHFIAQAESFERTTKAGLEQARASAARATDEQQTRLADVEQELRRIRGLGQRIAMTASQLAGGPR